MLKATPEKFVHVLDNINRFSSSRETSIKHQFTRVAQNLHDDLTSFCAACACTRFCYDVQQKTRTEYVHITFCTAIFLSLWSGSTRNIRWDLGVDCQWRIVSRLISYFLTLASVAKFRATFSTGGINSHAILTLSGSCVEVEIFNVSRAQWQIHELPVDYSIDPKLRCKTEHVGQHLYSGRNKDIVCNVTTTSMFLHSIVILVNGTVVTCGTMFQHYFPVKPVSIVTFKSGVFGKMYNWQSEYKTIIMYS